MPNSVAHFEIPADDLARAKAFYEKTFGWTIKPFPMPTGQEYFGITTKKKGEPGINGGMTRRNMPGQPFTNYITVKSIEAMNQIIRTNGGMVILPRQEIGKGMGWISAFKDPENNVIGLYEMAPAARQTTGARRPAAKKTRKRTVGKTRK